MLAHYYYGGAAEGIHSLYQAFSILTALSDEAQYLSPRCRQPMV